MHGNVARPLYLEDQIIEKKPMEPNIGVIGNEIAHLRSDVNELKEGMKTVNKTLGELRDGQTQLKGDINTVRAEMGTLRAELGTLRAEMGALGKQIDERIAVLETKIIKWVMGTGISCAGLAFTFAKFLK
jgi:chromosome segregation ATPase